MFHRLTHYAAKWLSKIQQRDTQPNGYSMFNGQTHSQIVIKCSINKHWALTGQMVIKWTNGYFMFDGHAQSQMGIKCSMDKHWTKWHAANWLSNVFPQQMIHHMQPNGYQMFYRQTHSQMVILCSMDRHTAKCSTTDDTSSYAAKWL